MTIEWMLYVLLVGTLLAIAALSIDGVLRRTSLPTRWVWLAALGGIVVLAIVAPRREPMTSAMKTVAVRGFATAVQVTPATSAGLFATIVSARNAVVSSLSNAFANASHRTPDTAILSLGVVWLLLSASVLSVLIIVSRRANTARRRWPLRHVDGTPVRVARATGPAVIGFARPEIVVPSWLLDRPADEQRLVLVHEREHVRARDQLLIAAGWIVVVLLPWHPAVWWSLSQLRLAIELDCDARVLNRGVQPRPYGSLLIDIAGQSAGLRIGALALADRTSHLERRLLAMKHSRTRFAFIRAGALCAIAFLSVAVACEARMPTSAEVDAMNVEGAEKAAVAAKLLADIKNSKRIYMVDGVVVSEAEAHAIAPIKIASMDIRGKQATGDKEEVRIYTMMHDKSLAGAELLKSKIQVRKRMPADSSLAGVVVEQRLPYKTSFDGLVLIDGVVSQSTAMAELRRDQIESIEVIKGNAATKISSDPAAANGIISIKMKAAAKP